MLLTLRSGLRADEAYYTLLIRLLPLNGFNLEPFIAHCHEEDRSMRSPTMRLPHCSCSPFFPARRYLSQFLYILHKNYNPFFVAIIQIQDYNKRLRRLPLRPATRLCIVCCAFRVINTRHARGRMVYSYLLSK